MYDKFFYNKNNTLIDNFIFKDMYVCGISNTVRFWQNFEKEIKSHLMLCTKDKMEEQKKQDACTPCKGIY